MNRAAEEIRQRCKTKSKSEKGDICDEGRRSERRGRSATRKRSSEKGRPCANMTFDNRLNKKESSMS